MKIIKKKNENYSAIVVEIKTLIPLEQEFKKLNLI